MVLKKNDDAHKEKDLCRTDNIQVILCVHTQSSSSTVLTYEENLWAENNFVKHLSNVYFYSFQIFFKLIYPFRVYFRYDFADKN